MGDGGGSGFSWVGTWSWWRVLSFPMNPPRPLSETTISRRSALGLLLAAGLWPGCVRVPSTQRPAGAPFTFAALNDLHHAQPECDPWFEAVFAQVAQVRPAFILLLGDLADRGDPASFATVRRLSERVGVPCYAVPGNHDNDVEKTPALFAAAFSGVLNSRFQHEGWQFVGLDSSDENKWRDTRVSAASLAWLDRELASLDPERPTVLFTHFPLAPDIRTQQGNVLTPLNAEAVLQRLVAFNLRSVLSGHFHGITERPWSRGQLVTGACCSRVRGNHDGTPTKGWWWCRAEPDGTLHRQLVPLTVG